MKRQLMQGSADQNLIERIHSIRKILLIAYNSIALLRISKTGNRKITGNFFANVSFIEFTNRSKIYVLRCFRQRETQIAFI
jgi:hypothetical protein